MDGVTRRQFLGGIGKASAVAAIPTLKLTLAVDDFPSEPYMADLYDLDIEVRNSRRQLAGVHIIRYQGRRYWDARDVEWNTFIGSFDEIRLYNTRGWELIRIPFLFTGNGGDVRLVWDPTGFPLG